MCTFGDVSENHYMVNETDEDEKDEYIEYRGLDGLEGEDKEERVKYLWNTLISRTKGAALC